MSFLAAKTAQRHEQLHKLHTSNYIRTNAMQQNSRKKLPFAQLARLSTASH
jgi:hypothetical protein